MEAAPNGDLHDTVKTRMNKALYGTQCADRLWMRLTGEPWF
jgi:hypothetical protein